MQCVQALQFGFFAALLAHRVSTRGWCVSIFRTENSTYKTEHWKTSISLTAFSKHLEKLSWDVNIFKALQSEISFSVCYYFILTISSLSSAALLFLAGFWCIRHPPARCLAKPDHCPCVHHSNRADAETSTTERVYPLLITPSQSLHYVNSKQLFTRPHCELTQREGDETSLARLVRSWETRKSGKFFVSLRIKQQDRKICSSLCLFTLCDICESGNVGS